MSPSSSLMRPTDSQESYSSDLPYDARVPPDYGSPPMIQTRNDETPLIVRQKRQPLKDTPTTVDNFAHELGRVAYDISTLQDVIEGVETLKADAASQESPVATLEALARRTTSAALLLSTSIPTLRTLVVTIKYLKPAASAFVVTNAETLELNQELYQTAQVLKAAVSRVDRMSKLEEGADKKDARMKLLKFIRGKEGQATGQSELMALLLGAEREGSEDAETLQASTHYNVDSYAWRWGVTRPGVRLARAVEDAGDATYLSKMERPTAPAYSLWANTWAYVPAFYGKSNDRKTSGYSAAGTKESMPVDASDEETGNFGEPVNDPTIRRTSMLRRWIYVFLILALLGAAGAGIAVAVKRVNHSPLRVSHTVHTYTLIPRIVYLRRAGKRFWLSFGRSGRVSYTR
ncbi:hypothetical protein JCM16303_006171 [Sporobolomyces ruberrimus]